MFDNFLVTAAADGFVRFYDFKFRLLAWYPAPPCAPASASVVLPLPRSWCAPASSSLAWSGGAQGYLDHKKQPPPPRTTLGP